MRTIILPGYSLHNKDWAYQVKNNLDLNHKVIVHEWRHWRDKSLSFNLESELKKIKEKIDAEKINIIAKSVGTLVAIKLLSELKPEINKIILCGIPSTSKVRKKIYKEALKDFSFKKIIVFQNTGDPFAGYQEVKKFFREIRPGIKVVEKPRKDHHYPYNEDFLKFL